MSEVNLAKIIEIQKVLYELNSSNIEHVKEVIINSPYIADQHGMREITHEFCYVVQKYPIDVRLLAALLKEIDQADEKFGKLKVFLAEEIINPAREINNTSKAGPFRLLRYCYLNGLYNDTNIFDYIQRFPNSRKLNFFLLFCFLEPEIQYKSPELFGRLKQQIESLKISDKYIQNAITNFNQLPLLDLIEFGCEKNSVNYQIRYENSNDVPDDAPVPYNPFESIIRKFSNAKEYREFLQNPHKQPEKLTKAEFLEAALTNDIELVSKCIQSGIHVDAADGRGQTALINAASQGHCFMVDYLLSCGAKVNKKGSWGETCLHTAAKCGSFTTVETLLSHGSDIYCEDESRWTPFFDAIDAGALPVAVILATKGTDLNRCAREGQTPLHVAAMNDYIAIAEFLVTNGAKVDSMDDQKRTPLMVAASRGNIQIIQFLVASGAVPDTKDLNGRTALHHAANASDVSVVEALLNLGAHPNSSDSFGRTPLMVAAAANCLACVECLVFKGADVFAVDTAGKTALEYTTNEEIKEYLGSLV
ncbi:ankyrin repeat protein, putative [Trichomonas vaginalis G3]|uniref:Ankyrin repeat protein, putative n=1 Tax=Trichomonas vaginalis (strain ATCC PRA-98 / G3) TaxID=412133 RepID=A2FT59_TRIV3|nr:protein ubiquitination [Trichomonas vaginalis G3]EAX91900.1 ankyrin repeat protein, putative [Trichomonas vaginalis G3]KAI5536761.1 protein ubiquitination [Trichomonas vaginalis G3]|eukprot:XP_001304830.1 ankyrin repeat protein [Trichomonas vaginalis G3]